MGSPGVCSLILTRRDLPERECSHPGCEAIVVGGFTCINHRHYTAAELAMIERKTI